MQIKSFKVNALEVNCYVVSDETKQGVIIDCGCSTESEWQTIRHYIESEGIEITHLLDTHLHFDHVWGNPYVYRDLRVAPEASALDLPLYENLEEMLLQSFGIRLKIEDMPALRATLKEGDTIAFGNTTLKVLSTPGHSQGSLCYYCEKEGVLFSGDTLFCGSMGRTDLQGGSMSEIMKSLRRLTTLPEDTKVLCGHGPSTTIAYEKRYNMYI